MIRSGRRWWAAAAVLMIAMQKLLLRTRYFAIGMLSSSLLIGLLAWPLSLSRAISIHFSSRGDVGLGFRSFQGRLEWIQYAPWSRNPDYAYFSLTWWLVCPATGLLLLWFWRNTIQKRARWRMFNGLCPKCKYDLQGNVEVGCPECGWRREAEK